MQPFPTCRPAPGHPADGFSLIEVLVASAVLATAIAGLVPLFLVAARANIDARDATYAAVLAAQKIEELRAAPFSAAAAGEFAEYLDPRGVLLDAAAGRRRAAYRRGWTIAPLPAHPLDAVVITVAVSRLHAANSGVRLLTIRTRKDAAP